MVFQEFELLEHLNVLDNILLPYRISPSLALDAASSRAGAVACLRDGNRRQAGPVRDSSLAGRAPEGGRLPGLLAEPSLLLADEPTGNLDPSNKGLVLDLLLDYAETRDAPPWSPSPTITPCSIASNGRSTSIRFLPQILMSDILYLAWRYLAYHRVKTAILVGSITLIVYLPVGLNVIVGQSAEELTARAEATPLLVGAKGSPLELVLNSLYFDAEPPEFTRHAEATRLAESGLADPIPLYVRFRSREHPIVGTTLEYFSFRGLECERWTADGGAGGVRARARGSRRPWERSRATPWSRRRRASST